MSGQLITLSKSTDILGVKLTSNLSYTNHVEARIQACRRNIYRFTSIGMSYPGLDTSVKSYLWNIIGSPTLLYGMECVHLSKSDICLLKSTQGSIIKHVMGVNKRSHHTNLLKALNITPVDELIENNMLQLYHRIFSTDTPLTHLQSIFLAKYLSSNNIIKGTLLGRVVLSGNDPLTLVFDKPKRYRITETKDGVIDSIRYLVNHENYSKPWSNEHILVTLLTKAF